MKKHGGERKGAGRKPSPHHLKKVQIGIKLPRWLIAWMKKQPGSRAMLIENAIRNMHNIDPPGK